MTPHSSAMRPDRRRFLTGSLGAAGLVGTGTVTASALLSGRSEVSGVRHRDDRQPERQSHHGPTRSGTSRAGYTWDTSAATVGGLQDVWDHFDGWQDLRDFHVMYLHWMRCDVAEPNHEVGNGRGTRGFQEQSHTPACTVYRRWSSGGSGLVTGNVMVHPHACGGNDVRLDRTSNLQAFRRWAKAGREGGGHLWMQINHPGRQAPGSSAPDGKTVAPSATPFQPPANRMFPTPRALEPVELVELVENFATTATLAKEAGFSGVQIHAAHGYSVNQFLSPLVNHRDDEWGGSPENRMRFLQEIYLRIREGVGPEFPVAIKLNSADFQRGGFSEEESRRSSDWGGPTWSSTARS